ncbi:hypothetical protein AJ80_02081 [Polytolypa hystricis UAMH7299]|uniref:MPN domain-containing protein n=1 Tax=Polytolypa hystricis (strain UAMH7299) TaxID=1447883 RepID=A0A2B7YS66_POLH7|nr:hypothetical protein AJ80_02081 [Polytolypa hystricis UAMH7299]
MPSRETSPMLPPLSVEQITRKAGQYEFDPLVPLRYWLRSATSLLKEASIYEREGNDQQAYLLLFRQAQLVIVHLASHPDAQDDANRRGLADAQREARASLNKLELLKPRISKRHERYVQLMRDRERRKLGSGVGVVAPPASSQIDPALAGVAQPLEPADNRELAVRLAQKEFDRRATSRKAAPPTRSFLEGQHNQYGDEFPDRTSAAQQTGLQGHPDDLSRRLQEVRSRIVEPEGARKHPSQPYRLTSTSRDAAQERDIRRQATAHTNLTSYKYPLVPSQNLFDSTHLPPLPNKEPRSSSALSSSSLAPELPAKIREPVQRSPDLQGPSPPPIPKKLSSPSALGNNGTFDSGKSSPSTDLNPSTYTFKPSAYLENGTPLRTIFISPDLRKHFLSIAASNTRRNLETCGILCGTLICNAFFISKLVIPEQEATSDTCEMINEAAMFDYCDSEDLMVLGWIHTHPTQTCFMSSRDLHTQSGYQAMLAESIAIVCAPSKDPDWGVFRLTDPPGLKTVLACKQPGLFHPHGEEDIYTDALRPGHVYEAKGLQFEIMDLR